MPLSSNLRNDNHILFTLSQQRLLLWVLAFAAIILFMGIGLRSPWPADEPRFAEVAREMVASGQWLIPMRGGEFYPDKPPVFMWAIAALYWLTGNLKVAFLLPNAICGLITIAAVFDLAYRLWGRQAALWSVVLLLIAPQFMVQAKNAQIDGMVACWITLGCYGLIRHFYLGPHWRWYFSAWAFMGLGIITKGVGFLPALLLIPILWQGWRHPQRFSGRLRWRCALGPLVMVTVAAAWLLPMVWYVDQVGSDAALAYRDNLLFKQTGERYANAWGHIQPWHYFIANVIPSLWFPLPLLLLALVRPLRDALRDQPVIAAQLGWVVLVVVFFSISPGKRGVYVLPALPMFALVLGALMRQYQPARWFNPALTLVQAGLALALIALGMLAWTEHPRLAAKLADYSRHPADLHRAGSLLLLLGLLWLAGLAIWWRSALTRWFFTTMLSWLLLATWGYQILEPLRTPRNVLAAAEQRLPEGASLGLIGFREQFILFSKLDVTHFSYLAPDREQERNAWHWQAQAPDRYLLVSEDQPLQCYRKDGAIELGVAHRQHWLLLGMNQRLPGCPRPDRHKQFTTEHPGRWMGPGG